MTITECMYCNFSYDEWYGDPKNGVPAGTPIQALAGTLCSRCGLQGERHQRLRSPAYADLEAEYYDQFAGKAGLSFYKRWLERWQERTTVLELGVGTGRLGTVLAQSASRYFGIDFSPEMLKVAKTKHKRLFKEDTERLQLLEADALTFQAPTQYSHVIAPDGFLQHFTNMDDHLALLHNTHSWLQDDGWLAVDIHLPPGGAHWNSLQRKRVTPKKWVSRTLQGETSLARQVYRCAFTYEVCVEGTMNPGYRIEREYALVTPKEATLLLATAGFRVMHVVQNYERSTPWGTILPAGLKEASAALGVDETLEKAVLQGREVKPYRDGAWENGGYPFGINHLPDQTADSPVTVTLLAQKVPLN